MITWILIGNKCEKHVRDTIGILYENGVLFLSSSYTKVVKVIQQSSVIIIIHQILTSGSFKGHSISGGQTD